MLEITECIPQRTGLEWQSFVNIRRQPVLHCHIPGSHAFPNRWQQLAAVYVEVVNCLKIVFGLTLIVTLVDVGTAVFRR